MARKKREQDVAGGLRRPRGRPPQQPHDGPQPGLERKLLKLRPETQRLLSQVATFRGEKYLDCVHNLLVEEVARRAEEMKAAIDHVAASKIGPEDSAR